jgi:hypothetical protein
MALAAIALASAVGASRVATDGEVAAAESGFVHGKHPHALVAHRKADG